jgi:hypothetical protein
LPAGSSKRLPFRSGPVGNTNHENGTAPMTAVRCCICNTQTRRRHRPRRCSSCRRERGALLIVPARRDTAIGHAIADGGGDFTWTNWSTCRLLLCPECVVDQVVTA